MAKQSNGQSNVVSSSDVQDMFTQFLASQGMSISDKGVVTSEAKEETVGDEINEFFDKVIENVQGEIDMVKKEDAERVYSIYKGKNGAKVGVLSNALLSDAPVIEYKLQHRQSNKDVRKGLEKIGFEFEFAGRTDTYNPMWTMTHPNGPTRIATMGRFNKQAQTKGMKEFRLA